MKRLISCDIETVPTDRALVEVYPEAERQPPANYRKPETIEKWRAEDRVEWEGAKIKHGSLNPRLCRVLAIGLHDSAGPINAVAMRPEDEPTLIANALSCLCDPLVVSYNGKEFDFRVIFLRAAILGVPLPSGIRPSMFLDRYQQAVHVDLKHLLCGFQPREGDSLKNYCAAFDIGCDDQTSGADIYGLYLNGDEAAISAHVASDARMTYELGVKCANAGLL